MVTAGIFPFKENSHGRTGNRTRGLMISSQRLWPLDHEADLTLEFTSQNFKITRQANRVWKHWFLVYFMTLVQMRDLRSFMYHKQIILICANAPHLHLNILRKTTKNLSKTWIGTSTRWGSLIMCKATIPSSCWKRYLIGSNYHFERVRNLQSDLTGFST